MRLTAGRMRIALLAEVGVLVLVSIGLYHLFGHKQSAASTTTSTSSGAVTDSFNRVGPGLGSAPGGTRWQVLGGDLVIQRGDLVAPDTPPADGAAALLPVRSVDSSTEATIGKVARGWSIVVRWQSPQSYWRLEAVPADGGYGLVHVLDGTARAVGHTGLASLRPGTQVELSAEGDHITVAIDGELRLTATDAHPAGRLAGVMDAPGAAAGSAWADVTVGAPANVVFPVPDHTTTPPP
jgi:hypothetical protein